MCHHRFQVYVTRQEEFYCLRPCVVVSVDEFQVNLPSSSAVLLVSAMRSPLRALAPSEAYFSKCHVHKWHFIPDRSADSNNQDLAPEPGQIPSCDQAALNPRTFVDKSRLLSKAQNEAWGLGYIDLYLIHVPIATKYIAPEELKCPVSAPYSVQ